VTAASGLIIVDKPRGMTSHDVVARIRRLAGTRRVGHAGTLDPMATGVLVIGVEKATRLLGHLALTRKEYSATIRLGQVTDTDDADGEIIAATPAGDVSAEALSAAARQLTGQIQQVPPGISAIKVAGQRAYRLTRQGAAPLLAPRTVTVTALRILAVRTAGDLVDVDVEVACSSGTYIRAIARDLGAALEVGGHLTALRRTRVGPYLLRAAASLDELAVSLRLIGLEEAAAAAFPRRNLTAEEARMVSHGIRLPAAAAWPAQAAAGGVTGEGSTTGEGGVTGAGSTTGEGGTTAGAEHAAPGGAAPGGPVAAFGPDGALVALLIEQDGQARSLAVFVP
jgi:tRNA pseudouridine55 synthase